MSTIAPHRPSTTGAKLPPELAAATGTLFASARNYPIFSVDWYRHRSVAMLTVLVLAVGVLLALTGIRMLGGPPLAVAWPTVMTVAAIYAAPLFALCLIGPGLAVWVHGRLAGRVEPAAILLALVAGMVASVAIWGGLKALYERPVPDKLREVDIVRLLPTVDLKVGVMYSVEEEPHDGPTIEPSPEFKAAYLQFAHAFGIRQSAAQVWPIFFAMGDYGVVDKVAKLRAGTLALPTDQHEDLERQYAGIVAKLKMTTAHNLALAGPHPGAEQVAAVVRLDAALPAPTVAAPPLVTPPSPQQADAINPAMHALSVTIMLAALLALAFWLGGVFDLFAFLRQRGKLEDVLARQELDRARAARNAAELRLSVLAAQVEPHFLFNTLASVRSAIGSDPARAAHIIDHMVDYLRASIPQMRSDAATTSVPLGAQLAAARSYLALMRERMPRLDFSVDAEPGLERASIPPLMLISLVENAVKHGIEPKVGPARIEVRARRVAGDGGEALEVSVRDDGVGFGANAAGAGIGLANIQERLRTYFGQRASLTLKGYPEGGVGAILRLPLTFEA